MQFGNYAVLAVCFLSACGGSTTGAGTAAMGDAAVFSGTFNEILTDARDLLQPQLASTDPGDLPENSLAIYEGVAIYDERDRSTGDYIVTALGEARVIADFATGALSSSSGNFFEVSEPNNFNFQSGATGTPAAGTIEVELEQVGTSNSFVGRATGTLSFSAGKVVTLDAVADADFEGDDAAYIDIDASESNSTVEKDFNIQAQRRGS